MIKDARVGCHNSQAPATLHTCPRATVGVVAKSCSAPSGFSFFLPPWPSTCARRDLDEEGAQSIFYGRAARRLHVHRAIIAETGRGNFWQSGRSVSRVEVQTGKLPPTRLLRKSISAKLRQICNQRVQQATPPTFCKSLRESSQTTPCVHFLCSLDALVVLVPLAESSE